LVPADTFLDYFVKLGRGLAFKQWSHLFACFIVDRTAVHRLEGDLIFKFNDSRVVFSFQRLQKLSAYKALKIGECLI
jgi:hypothetical protein